MQEKYIHSLSDALDYTRNLNDFCYRGQSNASWNLVPTIFRRLNGLRKDAYNLESWYELERNTYRNFADKARQFRPPGSSIQWNSDWERLCLAQHYGVPTRLLDWTSNLQVGLFFSVETLSPSDSALWCLDMSGLPLVAYEIVGRREPGKGYRLRTLPRADVSFFLEWSKSIVPGSTAAPIQANFFTIIQPAAFDKRIINQAGLFSVHVTFRHQTGDLVTDHTSYLLDVEKSIGKDILHKLIIPEKDKKVIRQDLLRTNVDHTFIFPDLSGLGMLLSDSYAKDLDGVVY